MDSTMSLFASEEFSLFGGDLLFPPAPPADEGFVTAPQDGLKITALSPALDWQDDDLSLGQNVLSDKQVSGGLLENWLDTRVDLLDFIDSGNALAGSQDLGLGLPEPEPTSLEALKQELELPVPEPTGLEALKLEVEKTFLKLSTEALEQPQQQQEPIVVAPILPSQGSENVYDQGLGLLELLTTEVGQTRLAPEDGTFPGQDLVVTIAPSGPILSPMSPEDVETILSSGPASPESLVTEESFESLMSSVMTSAETSFNDSAVMSEINTMDDDDDTLTNLPADLAMLSQMVMYEDNSDTTGSESDAESYHVSKTRPTPYQRGSDSRRTKPKKTPGSEDTAIIQDRKLRKKQQNKDAATRYRQKKKQEQELVNQEVAQLEGRNQELKDKVDQMTREIQYLKNLLSDVYKARSQKAKSK